MKRQGADQKRNLRRENLERAVEIYQETIGCRARYRTNASELAREAISLLDLTVLVRLPITNTKRPEHYIQISSTNVIRERDGTEYLLKAIGKEEDLCWKVTMRWMDEKLPTWYEYEM